MPTKTCTNWVGIAQEVIRSLATASNVLYIGWELNLTPVTAAGPDSVGLLVNQLDVHPLGLSSKLVVIVTAKLQGSPKGQEQDRGKILILE